MNEHIALVCPYVGRATRRNFALTPTVQVLATLWFYTSGSFSEVLEDGLGLSKASISRAVTAVNQVLLQLAERMTFPSTPEEIARANQGFHSIADIPRVIGVIDGTLIPIARPSNSEPVYVSRNGLRSIECTGSLWPSWCALWHCGQWAPTTCLYGSTLLFARWQKEVALGEAGS